MSEQNTNGVETTEANGSESKAHLEVYATLVECQAITPPSDKFRTFEVSKDGEVVGYTWASGVGSATQNAAKAAGYTACVAESKRGGAVTKEKIASRLAEFTDEELAALGLSRKKAKTQKV